MTWISGANRSVIRFSFIALVRLSFKSFSYMFLFFHRPVIDLNLTTKQLTKTVNQNP